MERNAFERLQGSRFFRCLDFLCRLVLVNLCILLLSLCGLVVLGLFPAIFAAAAYLNDIFEYKEGKLLPAMFGYFRKYFWIGNLLMALAVPAAAMALYAVYGRELNTFLYLLLFVWMLCAASLCWYLPAVNVLYPEFTLGRKILFSLVASGNRWALTLMLFAAGIVWLTMLLLVPQLLMFVMFSVPACLGMWWIKRALKPDSFFKPEPD